MSDEVNINPRVAESARGGLNQRIGAELVRRLGQRWFNDRSLGTCDTCGYETPLERAQWDRDANAMLALLDAMRELGFRFQIQQIDSIGIYDSDPLLGAPGFQVRAFRVPDGGRDEWEWEPIENPNSPSQHDGAIWRETTAPLAVAKAAARALGVDADV